MHPEHKNWISLSMYLYSLPTHLQRLNWYEQAIEYLKWHQGLEIRAPISLLKTRQTDGWMDDCFGKCYIMSRLCTVSLVLPGSVLTPCQSGWHRLPAHWHSKCFRCICPVEWHECVLTRLFLLCCRVNVRRHTSAPQANSRHAPRIRFLCGKLILLTILA